MSVRFETDIFISYAHRDNKPLIDGMDGWVTTFHTAVSRSIEQILGVEPRIFRDKKLKGSDEFAGRLDEEVARSAVLLAIVSPAYTRSEWCRRELDAFVEAAEARGGLRNGNRFRILKVIKHAVDLEQQAPVLRKMLGYSFCSVDHDTDRSQLFCHDGDEASRAGYFSRLSDAAHDLAELLSELRTAPATVCSTRPAQWIEAASHPPVYLAQTSLDAAGDYDAVRRELQDLRRDVRPSAALPLLQSQLTSQIAQDLDGCELAVHILGTNYGVIPEAATHSIVEQQEHFSRDVAQSGRLWRILWLPRDLGVTDARQRDFIESLRRHQAGRASDLIECSVEDLKNHIRKRLEVLAAARAAPERPPQATEGEGNIYLISREHDQEATEPIADCLFDRGYAVTTSLHEGSEEEVRGDHKQSLAECDAALLYYADDECWLRRNVREVTKMAATRDEEKPLHAGVYLHGSTPSPTLRRSRMPVVPGDTRFRPEHLDEFIAAIRGA